MQQICNAPFSYTNPHLITIASKIKTKEKNYMTQMDRIPVLSLTALFETLSIIYLPLHYLIPRRIPSGPLVSEGFFIPIIWIAFTN